MAALGPLALRAQILRTYVAAVEACYQTKTNKNAAAALSLVLDMARDTADLAEAVEQAMTEIDDTLIRVGLKAPPDPRAKFRVIKGTDDGAESI